MRGCHLVLLVGLMAGSGAPARADSIALTLSKTPTDATLTWSGDVPNFEVYRGPGPAGIVDSSHALAITGGSQVVDSQVPLPGAGFYYLVVTLGPCAPLSPATICGAGARCYPTPDHLTACSGPVGAGTQGAFCSTDADCASTFLCAGANGCAKWCRIGFTDCSPGLTCVSLIPAVYAGAQQYGACF